MGWNPARRLYVAEFDCGVIKAGITGRAAGRGGLQFNGRAPRRIHYCAWHECGFWGERALIERLRSIATLVRGREYFVGIRFGAARLLAEQITRQAKAVQTERA